jgi:hypothetical protein
MTARQDDLATVISFPLAPEIAARAAGGVVSGCRSHRR